MEPAEDVVEAPVVEASMTVYPNTVKKYTGCIRLRRAKIFEASIVHKDYTKSRNFKTRKEAFKFIKRRNKKHRLPIHNILERFPDRLEVELTRGLHMICDNDDFDFIQEHIWHATKQGYAATRLNGKIKKFHNLVIGFTPHDDITVDHLNRNRLDNRIENLSEATPRDQNINQSTRKDNTSGIKGVYKKKGSWMAKWTTIDGVTYSKSFGIKKYGGDDAAKSLAIAHRKVMVLEHYQ